MYFERQKQNFDVEINEIGFFRNSGRGHDKAATYHRYIIHM